MFSPGNMNYLQFYGVARSCRSEGLEASDNNNNQRFAFSVLFRESRQEVNKCKLCHAIMNGPIMPHRPTSQGSEKQITSC